VSPGVAASSVWKKTLVASLDEPVYSARVGVPGVSSVV